MILNVCASTARGITSVVPKPECRLPRLPETAFPPLYFRLFDSVESDRDRVGVLERARRMTDIMGRFIPMVAGAIALCTLGTGSAAAADIPAPQAQVQPPPPSYYPRPPIEEGYAPPPPAVYGYPPPPDSYYSYAPPPVVVMPRPYYFGRNYGPIYNDRAYGLRGYGPYIARGYGRYYDHSWGRGFRRW